MKSIIAVRDNGPGEPMRCHPFGCGSLTFHSIACGTVTCDSPAFQATAPSPFFATSVRSFSEVPRGRFSPRSHWLTRPVVTLR